MQYTMPPFNGLKVLRKPVARVMTDYIFRVFRNTHVILNTEELASKVRILKRRVVAKGFAQT